VPSPERGLLARLDALVTLAADRHGLALLPDGRLAAAEARVAVRATGLGARARPTRGRPSQPAAATPATPAARAEPAPQDPAVGRPPGGRGLALVERDAVELLRAVAEGVGLLRVRGDRLEATSLRHAWTQIDESLRAGLVYAAWCHRVPWPAFLHGGAGVEALVGGRLWVLRLLFGLPAGVEVGVPGLTATVAGGLGLDGGDWLDRAVTAAFLDPLVALGVAALDPPPPNPAAALRLLPRASTVIGSALVAAGEEVPLAATPAN
jgi:hypothetical protein